MGPPGKSRMVLLTLISARLHRRSMTPISQALQAPLVRSPGGPWWSRSPPVRGSTALPRVRFNPAQAGCAEGSAFAGGGPGPLPRTSAHAPPYPCCSSVAGKRPCSAPSAPSSPASRAVMSAWTAVTSGLKRAHFPSAGSGKGPGQEPGSLARCSHSAPARLVTLCILFPGE